MPEGREDPWEVPFGELAEFSINRATSRFYWITPEGKFVNTNETLRDRLGYSEDELKEMHVWDIDPNYSQENREEFWERLKEEKTRTFQSEHKTKSGEVYPVEITSHYIEYGEEQYFEFAFAKEISEREKAKKKYRDLFESAEVAIIIHGSEGEITSANPAAEKAFGLTEEQLKEKSLDYWKGMLYKENGEPMDISEFPVSKVLDSKQPVEEQIIGLSPEETREIKWHVASAAPQFNEKGEIERVINSFKDITTQKEAEERKDFLNTLLRQDLRSKYQTIQGYLQLIEEEMDLSDEHREHLRKTIRAGREADEILDLAKELEEIEGSEWVTEKDIVKVLENVMDNISGLVEREEVEIEENYPEKISKVKGDYSLNTLFTQLLMTRIQNSKCDKIGINASEREEDILLKIKDDGKQLPEDIKNLFTGEAYTGETTGGGGVRYYMIRQIAEHNNAEINVKDSEIGGARFDVHLQKA